MKLFENYLDTLSAGFSDQVVTIGNFDGIHKGHQVLLNNARKEADRLNAGLLVLTFEPHPASFLYPDNIIPNLLSKDRKTEIFTSLGVDILLYQKFDNDFASLPVEAFIKEVLVKALRARVIAVGTNFTFGSDRKGNTNTLHEFGKLLGFTVISEPLAKDGESSISSSRIRQLLLNGDIRQSTSLLGRYYELSGQIKEDRKIGREMGFPTINLTDVSVLKPKSGIYAAFCEITSDNNDSVLNRYLAAVYIGNRPTMKAGFSIEAHLLNFNGNLYGSKASLYLVDRIRDDIEFSDAASLTAQIKDDIMRISRILEQER